MPDNNAREWVTYNPRTGTYDTPDGTCVAAWLVDNAQSMADVLRIAQIRARQRLVAAGNASTAAITADSVVESVAATLSAIAEANDKHPLAQFMVKNGANHRTHYVFLNSDDAAGFDLPDFARASPNVPRGEVMFIMRKTVEEVGLLLPSNLRVEP